MLEVSHLCTNIIFAVTSELIRGGQGSLGFFFFSILSTIGPAIACRWELVRNAKSQATSRPAGSEGAPSEIQRVLYAGSGGPETAVYSDSS